MKEMIKRMAGLAIVCMELSGMELSGMVQH
jgi:hypothetical protein